jgi:hypothetical protein
LIFLISGRGIKLTMEMLHAAYPSNDLAERLLGEVKAINFGDGCRMVPVTELCIADQIEATEIKGIDYRAKTKSEDGFAPVFDGVAFDSKRVRSQAFALYEGKSPVGVMTTVIAPRTWIAEQRYFAREDGGVRVVDAHAVTGVQLPDFYIIPAWAKVLPSHRLKFAIPGFRAFKMVINIIEEVAPSGTWMEVIAQGRFPFERKGELINLSDRGLDTFIPEDELPFDPGLIGKSDPFSSSSAKMAQLMDMRQVEKLGSNLTLGPVFAKQVA